MTLIRFSKVFPRHTVAPNVIRRMATTCVTTNTVPSLLSATDAINLLKSNSNVKILDGSWHLNKARDAIAEFAAERVPNAQYINIDDVSDKSSSLPHMIPSATEFSDYVSNLGISSDNHVIVYTAHESFSAPRVWWMFKLFGHNNVSVLNGGLPAWKAAGGEIETGPAAQVQRGNFSAKLNEKLVVGVDDVLSIVNTGSAQICDARSAARFLAEAPEPRPGLPSGHIPGSLSLPFTSLMKEGDVNTFRSKEEIRDAFVDSGVVFGSKVVLSCGSGVTAAVLGFGLHLIGKDLESCPVYDGSWTEWASREDLPRAP